MKLITHFRSCALAAFLCATAMLPTTGSAQDLTPAQENHPSIRVVREYLKCMLEQNWTGSAELVETRSLEDLRSDYVKRVKATATLDEEKMVVSKFGVKTLEEIEKLSGAQFYISYHKLLKERSPVAPEVLQKVRDSMQLRILSLAVENDKLAHVLVRTKHNNDKVQVESIEVISLIKTGDKWMVGLNEQAPKITPLKALGAGAAPASTTPAAATPAPAPEPTKPAPTKPTTKPKAK